MSEATTKEQWIQQNYHSLAAGPEFVGDATLSEMLEFLRERRKRLKAEHKAEKKKVRRDPWALVGGVPEWVRNRRTMHLLFEVDGVRYGNNNGIVEVLVTFPDFVKEIAGLSELAERLVKMVEEECREQFIKVVSQPVVRIEWGFCSPRDNYVKGFRREHGYPHSTILPFDLGRIGPCATREMIEAAVRNQRVPSWLDDDWHVVRRRDAEGFANWNSAYWSGTHR